MKITSFWARGYRSLRDVRMNTDRAFNVFYGPNGAGKSNILDAMRALLALLEERTRPDLMFRSPEQPWVPSSKARPATRDRCHLVQAAEMFLGMSVSWQADEQPFDIKPVKFSTIDIEVGYAWDTQTMRITRLSTGDYDLFGPKLRPSPSRDTVLGLQNEKLSAGALGHSYDESAAIAGILGVPDDRGIDNDYQQWLRALVRGIARRAFCLVPADRAPRAEELGDEKLTSKGSDISDLLTRGRLKQAFFRAGNHPDAVIRHRYKQLQALLIGPPLDRPPFVVTHDPDSGKLEIVEEGGESPYRVSEVPLDLAGLGIAQIYSILAQIVLPGMRAVGIEEPEAHLHAPTTGRDLREILERVVEEHYIDQLFIATHSNLFDLDPNGYHEVTMDRSEGTRVVWKSLSQVDAHLYEPGPAKRALIEFLTAMGDEDVGIRDSNGQPITTSEMLEHLQRDDDLAVEFLQGVHAAAVRMAMLRKRKKSAGN